MQSNKDEIVTFGEKIKTPNIMSRITLEDVFFMIYHAAKLPSNEDKVKSYKTIIDIIRDPSSSIEKKKYMKSYLPWISGSLFNDKRSISGFVCAKRIIADIDNVNNPDLVKQKCIEYVEFCTMAFISPSGNGVKLICELAVTVTDAAQFKKIATGVFDLIQARTGYVVDKSCTDAARSCYLSYDPDIYFNPYCKKADISDYMFDKEVFQSKKHQETRRQEYTNNSNRDTVIVNYLVDHLCCMKIEYQDWIRIGHVLKSICNNGEQLWMNFADNPNYPNDTATKLSKVWENLRTSNRCTIGSLIYIGEKYGIDTRKLQKR